MKKPLEYLSPEAIADIEACLMDDRGTIRYWLTVGVPEERAGLSKSFPQELIDEVQQEIDNEL